MDKREVRKKVEKFAKRVAKDFPGCEIILFGSHVSGQPHEYSDIDVAVVIPELKEDFLTLSARLVHLRNDIDPMIEPHLMLENGNNGGFLEEVKRTGQVIYRAA